MTNAYRESASVIAGADKHGGMDLARGLGLPGDGLSGPAGE